jgi:hypothetical protein
MPIPTGTQPGSYEITGPLGAGGMGEVYRARGTKMKVFSVNRIQRNWQAGLKK